MAIMVPGLKETMILKFVEVIIFSAIGLMLLTALSALVNRAAMGGNSDFTVFNLKRTRARLARRMWLAILLSTSGGCRSKGACQAL